MPSGFEQPDEEAALKGDEAPSMSKAEFRSILEKIEDDRKAEAKAEAPHCCEASVRHYPGMHVPSQARARTVRVIL